MRSSMAWVFGVGLFSMTACATGVIGDSTETEPPSSSTKNDDAGYSPPWQPIDASQGGETGPSSQGDAGTSSGGDAGSNGSGNDAGEDSSTPTVDAATGGQDSGGTGLVCGGYALPGTSATCNANCSVNNCNANGCYGTYWCDTNTGHCVAPVYGCDAGP
jgi:hypothetical protein